MNMNHRFITDAHKRIGLPAPTFTEEVERIEQQRRAVNVSTEFDPAATRTAVLAALDAGKDPLLDKSVQRAAAALSVGGMVRSDAQTWADSATTAAVKAAAPELIATWQAWAEQVERDTLAPARDWGIDLTDRTIQGGAAERARLWAAGREAVAQLEQLLGAWSALAREVRADDRPQFRALVPANIGAGELDALGHRPDVASIVTRHALNLATFEDYAQRVERIASDRAAAQRDYSDASAAAIHQRFGF